MAGVQIDGVNNKIDFDDDQDTSISANTDDTLVFEIAGATDFTMTANTFTAASGSTIAAQALTATTVTASGIIKTDDTTAATSTTDGSLQTDGGLSVVLDAVIGDDLLLLSDASVIKFGADSDVTLTHEHNVGLILGGAAPVFTIGDGGAEDTQLRFDGNAQNFAIGIDDSTDKLTISKGNTLGTTVAMTIDENALITLPDGAMEIIASGNYANLTLTTTDADANFGPELRLYRNSANPADDDVIGIIDFEGKDSGGNDTIYARIQGEIMQESDGSEDGQLQFDIMKAGTVRNIFMLDRSSVIVNEDSQDVDFRVESNNNINMFKVDAGDDRTHHGGTSHTGSTLGVHNFYAGTTTDQPGIILSSNSASYADELLTVGTLRSASTAYHLFEGRSGNGSDDAFNDIEFKVNGVGAVIADGAYDGSGADYAEYFEWKDGNSSAEDRRGYSVVLDGNKIVKATDSDDAVKIIGVISAVPVVVGDSDIDRWKEKYLRDDFGSPIMEEFTVTTWRDEANKTDHSYATDRIPTGITSPSDATVSTTEADGVTKLIRKKLNPDWNKDTTYISREDRKEWDTVGLVGKLRMKKGQKTGTNWIKMRDISDTVEEWLVR